MNLFKGVFRLVTGRFAALAAVVVLIMPAYADVREGYDVPRFTIPYAEAKPQIDGVIHPEEWRGALEINLLQQLGSRQVSAMQATWFLMWDEDNLYVAMRSPLREGERLLQGQRRRDRDYNVVWDDSYEFWLDAGSRSPDGQPVFFQLLANYAGSRFDCMFEPAVGNSRLGWTSGWEPVNRVAPDGSAWEFEMAVPRDSIYAEPFSDGHELRMLLARNFKRPWLQNSITGQNDFSSRDAFARFTLSRSAPATHIMAVGNPAENTFGIALSVFAEKQDVVQWSFETETGVSETGELKVPARQTAIFAKLDMANAAPDKFMRLRVTTDKGQTTLADWSAKMDYSARDHFNKAINDKGDYVKLSASLNPVMDYIRVTGDFIQYDNRDAITGIEAAVFDSGGKKLAEAEFMIDDLAYADGVIRLEDLAPGEYRIEMYCRDSEGNALVTREASVKKLNHAEAFPWWNTKRGNKDTVLPPWTPVRYNDGTFKVWGRAMSVNAPCLPAAITTQDRELLSGPVVLKGRTADGDKLDVTGSGSVKISGKPAPHRVVVEGKATLGADITVSGRVTMEYDGVAKFELTLNPAKPVDLASLQLIIPFNPDAVNYVHGSGEGIRYGFDTMALPEKGTGRLWDSRRVDGQPMRVGSFIPYVWVGSTAGGLAWFADSDEGWFPNDNHPAIEIRRDSRRSTDLILNLASGPVTLDRPRKIVFGLQATPVKPLTPGWRANRWTFDATFHDFAGITTLPGRQHSDLIWQAVPYVIDEEYAKNKAAEWKKTRGMAVPYFEQNVMGRFRPDPDYFGEHWRARIGNTLWFEKTLQDFIVYNLAEWVEIADIDGWYVDNVRPEACDNIEAGRGYLLPDGRIQPTFQIFDQRDYWLRVRAAFIEAGKNPPVLVLHMTHNMVIQWLGAAEIALDHEANVIFPEMKKTFMDVWTPERLRLDYPGQWGVAVISMSKYDGNWSGQPKEVLERNWRSFVGANRLHDTLIQSENQRDAAVRKTFGFGETDVAFAGYWDENNPVRSMDKQVLASVWMRPGQEQGKGKMLVIVTNWEDDIEARIRINAKTAAEWIGPRSTWRAVEPESGASLDIARNGEIKLPVPRHHYRYILITTE